MATGTGKTFTALSAAAERRDDLKHVAVLVFVPYLHLLEQWREHCEGFGFFPILCSGNHKQWSTDVRSKIQDYCLGVLPSICILAVHQTAATKRFSKAIQGLPSETTLIIADEVHCLGAPRLRDALLPIASMRLGLSATPRRWYDQEGTKVLLEYFTHICFEFPLDKAIGKYLTPYRYLPILAKLTDQESEKYEILSRKIASLSSNRKENDEDAEDRLKRLLLKRSQIISAAEKKIPLLIKELKQLIEECSNSHTELKHVLVIALQANIEMCLKKWRLWDYVVTNLCTQYQ
jgi:superfamily II DNA or RNA helicase